MWFNRCTQQNKNKFDSYMYIKDYQIKALEALISEGFLCQSHALEGKKKYLQKVQEWLGKTCKENNTEVPVWVYTLNTEIVDVKDDMHSNQSYEFVDKQIVYCLQFLQDIRTVYYTKKQLSESQKQTKRLKWANWISFAAFVAAISIPFLVKCCCN